MARTAKLVVMIDEGIRKELQELAEGMGLTASALSAYVLGQFVHQQRTIVKPITLYARELLSQEAKRLVEATEAVER